MRTLRRPFILLLLLFTVASCADHCSRAAYNNVVKERTESFPHTAKPDAIWRATTAELEPSGAKFATKAAPIDEFATSAWTGKPNERVRYEVKITRGSDIEHYLEVWRSEEELQPTFPDAGPADGGEIQPNGEEVVVERKRDIDTEFAVLQQLDPTTAAEIEVAAAQRAEEVRDVVANGCK